jgi:hypothetical protein
MSDIETETKTAITEAVKAEFTIPAALTKEIAAIDKKVSLAGRSNKTTFLLYGQMGTGKTHAIMTAPLPIHVDSFDPGGTKTIRTMINTGEIIADTSWEDEDPENPKVFMSWLDRFDYRISSGYFNNIATYAIDSTTTLLDAIMNKVLKDDKRAGKHPFQQDWMPQMNYFKVLVRKMSKLPCHIILIAHEDRIKDERTGSMESSPMMTGKLKATIPTLFDEVYRTAMTTDKKGNCQVSFQVVSDEQTKARTRILKGGEGSKFIEPNFKKLLKQAGMDYADKTEIVNELKRIKKGK